jgi:hypothetical protein
MSESLAPWWRRQDWWIDHWADVIGAIIIPLMLYMVDCNNNKAGELLVRKQIDIQQQTKNESAAEADNHQAIELLANLSTHIGKDDLQARRAMAQAVLGYANQGRLYHPSTAVAADYLRLECDEAAYQLLAQAVARALLQTPKNATIPSCGDKSTADETLVSCSDRRKKALKAVADDQVSDRTRLRQAELDRIKMCPGATSAVPADAAGVLNESMGPGARTFRQYLDVGCAETNQGSLNIPLSDEESKTLKVDSVAKAHFEGVSNLNWTDAKAWADADGDQIGASYRIRGLDRQAMGNCPGGGHATLVVEYQLVPLPVTADTQAAPANMPLRRSIEKVQRAFEKSKKREQK